MFHRSLHRQPGLLFDSSQYYFEMHFARTYRILRQQNLQLSSEFNLPSYFSLHIFQS